MILSILICTLPEPYYQSKLRRLLDVLEPQIVDGVDILINNADRNTPTGLKRNNMVRESTGQYFQFIDCDDMITDDFVSQVMSGIEKGVDVVTMRGWMTTNGINRREWTIKLGSGYTEKDGHYYRWPNHLAAMRRDKVSGVQFPAIWVQEDYHWSKIIHERKLLKTEYHINKPIYHYDYWDKDKRHNHQTIKNRR